jgi:hypothetical protein
MLAISFAENSRSVDGRADLKVTPLEDDSDLDNSDRGKSPPSVLGFSFSGSLRVYVDHLEESGVPGEEPMVMKELELARGRVEGEEGLERGEDEVGED